MLAAWRYHTGLYQRTAPKSSANPKNPRAFCTQTVENNVRKRSTIYASG